ncbi:hypothetical protein M422DRAFT_271111, partial [Sphaerobolus stellatus SS14]
MSTRSGRSYSQKPIHRRSRLVGATPSPRLFSPLVDDSSPTSDVAQPTLVTSGLGRRVSSSRLSSDKVDGEYHSLTRSASPTQGVTAKVAPVINSGADNIPFSPVSNSLSIADQAIFPVLDGSNNNSLSHGHPAAAVDYWSHSPTAGGRVHSGEVARDASDSFPSSHHSYAHVAKLPGTSVLPVNTDVNPTADPARNNDKKSNSIHSTTPHRSNPPPDIPSAPRKTCASYRHNDGFSIPRCTASPKSSVSKVDMTGSKIFNDWFENSDNETITDDEMAVDNIPQNASPPSTSIETQPVKHDSDKSYKKFMSGVLEEMPTPDRDL